MFYLKKTLKRLYRHFTNSEKDVYLAPIVYCGHNVFFECKKNSFIEKKVLLYQNHCNYILDSISNFIVNNSYFIDIGANIGTVSLSIAKKYKSNGLKVLSFEAPERYPLNSEEIWQLKN